MTLRIIRLFKLLVLLTLFLTTVPESFAEGDRGLKRFFYPHEDMHFYSQSEEELSDRGRWRIKIHGLRMTPLHPDVWAHRTYDRTDNRVLIPIRPFYLRRSAKGNFRVKEIRFNPLFQKLDPWATKKSPQAHSPILDIGIAGAFELGEAGRRPTIDRGFVMRLSASALVSSGAAFRSHSTFKYLEKFPALESGREYSVRLVVEEAEATLYLNGSKVSTLKGANLQNGLLSLTSGWHPVYLDEMSIVGELVEGEETRKTVDDGVVKVQ